MDTLIRVSDHQGARRTAGHAYACVEGPNYETTIGPDAGVLLTACPRPVAEIDPIKQLGLHSHGQGEFDKSRKVREHVFNGESVPVSATVAGGQL